MNKILVLAGPSAVGKTTVMGKLISQNPSFEYIRSATTRAPRGDGHDSEYIYLSVEEFKLLIDSGGVLEYTEYGGNYYGTPISEIERIFECGKIPLLILDINGVKALKSKPHSFSVVAIYITADTDVLDKRLYERFAAAGKTESAAAIYETRREQNRKDLETLPTLAGIFDAFVENTTPDETASKILSLFESVQLI